MKKLFFWITGIIIAIGIIHSLTENNNSEYTSTYANDYADNYSNENIKDSDLDNYQSSNSSSISSQNTRTETKKTIQAISNTSRNCNIKGNISYNGGEKIYHVPGCTSYNATVIDTSKGERRFCTEEEARAAGWRKAYNCP